MTKLTTIKGVIVDNNTTKISFVEVCRQYEISEDTLLEMLEYGLIGDIPIPGKNMMFNHTHLQRILSARRLHKDLDINAQGVILALELLDELTEMRRQLDILRRHLHG